MAAPDRPAPSRRRWTRGEKLVVAAGVLLVVDLVAFPWHHYALDTSGLAQFGVHVPSFARNVNGVHDPQALFGIAALLVALAMVVQVLATKASAALPRQEQVHLVAGPVVAGLVAAKLLANHDFLGIGAWVGMVLAAGVAYGGFLLSQETTAGADDATGRAG